VKSGQTILKRQALNAKLQTLLNEQFLSILKDM